jgi:hypothetical protein
VDEDKQDVALTNIHHGTDGKVYARLIDAASGDTISDTLLDDILTYIGEFKFNLVAVD